MHAAAAPYQENRHNAVGAWFLGPRAENFGHLKEVLDIVLKEQEKARKSYYPEDEDFISAEMQASGEFQEQITRLKTVIAELSTKLAKHSAPFWNPRYNGHMVMDTSMPGIAGYLAGMLFNSNNITVEASPLTTAIEKEVGLELSEMVGFNRYTLPGRPIAWGHITCGGSIANLEAVWAARSLKFYPLSLRLAMEPGRPLAFITDTFQIPTCKGQIKHLRDFTIWELLNIIPNVTLSIPDRLYAKYHLTPQFLQKTLEQFLIHTLSKDADAFKQFGREHINNMALMTSATRHYSWPKSAAITGIGSSNLIGIKVDHAARMDMADLKLQLDACLNALPPRAVYAVIGVIGSTENGACDPLDKMVRLRDEYREKGLSFVLHVDGAWGAYFASMLPREGASTAPSLALKPTIVSAISAMRHCDSVTVDPHKSGFIQYPAGGLLYRDGRMRYQVTWTSPTVSRNNLEGVGIYGIEGSKPGAAAVATWVSHLVIGLNQKGYGEILGEALFSCVKLYAHLVTMSTDNTDFILRPLNMLPTEITSGDVEEQKEFIRTRILNRSNEELIKDPEVVQLIHDMGSDLAINAFAVNFKCEGRPNENVVEANNLNKRIFERLSINDDKKDVNTIPLILTSTQFGQAEYGDCLTNFKKRLGLSGKQDLYALVNVVISPFPTTHHFTANVLSELQRVIEEEVKISQYRNTITPDLHGFIMQGTDQVHLVHLPMFNMANYWYQLVITGDLPADIMARYVKARRKYPGQFFTLGNANRDTLWRILMNREMEANINIGFPAKNGTHFLAGFMLTNIKVVYNWSIENDNLSPNYPSSTMPFYIYGTKDQVHIDHSLRTSPNIQLSSDQVKLEGPSPNPIIGERWLVAHFQNVPENAMQPFPDNATNKTNENFFFRPNTEFDVILSKDIDAKDVKWKGKLILGDTVFADVDMLNMDPDPRNRSAGAGGQNPNVMARGAPTGATTSLPDSFMTGMTKHSPGIPRGLGYVNIVNQLKARMGEESDDGERVDEDEVQ